MAKKKTKKKIDYSKEIGMAPFCSGCFCRCGKHIETTPICGEIRTSAPPQFAIECPDCGRMYWVVAEVQIISEFDRNKLII